MVNEDLLNEYINSIKEVQRECSDAGLSDEEFHKLYHESLKSLRSFDNDHSNPQTRPRFRYKYSLALAGIIIILCAAYNSKTIYSSLICNLQDYIYPGLRLLRRISIPLISLFPSLTEYYHETCLIQNPFFTVVDMDCWPCSTINNVQEVYDPKPVMQQQTAPFIYETKQQVIKLETLKDIYFKNMETFEKESPKVLVNNKYFISVDSMFHDEQYMHDKNFYIWRFNTMNVARLIRQIIPRPNVVPKFGQSTERFIIVDSSQQSFQIPDTECSFSFLLALSGSRTVHLIPAEECKHQCKSLKIELKESYLLWYNWWYWRPVIQSSTGNTTLIVHVGSYC